MSDRTLTLARWALAVIAVVVAGAFLLQQRQGDIDVSYGESPSSDYREGDGGELSDHTVPSTDEMARRILAERVVRLPGANAAWDQQWVLEHTDDVRFLFAPPGLDEQERDRVREVSSHPDVANAPFELITVMGTRVSGGVVSVSSSDLDEFRSQFGVGDVTELVLTAAYHVQERDDPPQAPAPAWRAPTAAELDVVARDLERDRLHVAEGATLDDIPASAKHAFPDTEPMVVALPRPDRSAPIPQYAPALAQRFPDTPIVVMYDAFVDYAGPYRDDFYEVATAGFYGVMGQRLATYDYPQGNVLGAWLNDVTDVRYAGLFDRPLPYQPIDPLKVTMPALPWVFAACVAGFLALSVGSVRRSSRATPPTKRIAALTALAVEVSGLTGPDSNPPLTRAITHLDAAKDLDPTPTSRRYAHALLDKAERELAQTARLIGRPDYDPARYVAGWGA